MRCARGPSSLPASGQSRLEIDEFFAASTIVDVDMAEDSLLGEPVSLEESQTCSPTARPALISAGPVTPRPRCAGFGQSASARRMSRARRSVLTKAECGGRRAARADVRGRVVLRGVFLTFLSPGGQQDRRTSGHYAGRVRRGVLAACHARGSSTTFELGWLASSTHGRRPLWTRSRETGVCAC